MPKKRPNPRLKVARWIWLAACLLCVGIWLYPVGNEVIRWLEVMLTGLCILGAIILWWPCRWLLGLVGVIALFLLWPGRDYDRQALREAIAARLPAYEGTRWVWGGENFLGMDGPGLVRRSAIEGTALHGLRTCNPRLLRMALGLWWQGFPQKSPGPVIPRAVRKVTETPSLADLADRNLHPGDFAIIQHEAVLVYAGNHTWFLTSDSLQRVVSTRTETLPVPATVLRWRYLEMPR